MNNQSRNLLFFKKLNLVVSKGFILLLLMLLLVLVFLGLKNNFSNTKILKAPLTLWIQGEIKEVKLKSHDSWVQILVSVKNTPLLQKKSIHTLSLSASKYAFNLQNFQKGKVFVAKVSLLPLGRQKNPDIKELDDYLYARGVSSRGYIKNIVWTHSPPRVILLPKRIQNFLSQHILSITPSLPKETQGLLPALLVGDSRFLSSKTFERFQRSGTLHILIVSGMHISLLFLVSWFLFSYLLRLPSLFLSRSLFFNLSKTRNASLFLALLIAWIYALIAGFSGSTERAFLMLLPFVFTLFFEKRLRLFVALIFSILMILCFDAIQGERSFQGLGIFLSYAAIFAIYFAVRHHEPFFSQESLRQKGFWFRVLKKFLNGFKLLLRLQIYIFLMVSPLILYAKGGVSPLSIPVNLVLTPWMELLALPLLFFLLPLSFVSWGGLLFEKTAWFFLTPLQALLSLTENTPLLRSSPSFLMLFLGLLGVVFCLRFPKRFWAIGAFILLIPWAQDAHISPAKNTAKLLVFSTGNQSTILIETHQKNFLFGAQGAHASFVARKYLEHHNLKLQAWIQPNTKHFSSNELKKLSHGSVFHPGFCQFYFQEEKLKFRVFQIGTTCALSLWVGKKHLLLLDDASKRNQKQLLSYLEKQKAYDIALLPNHGYKKGYEKHFPKKLAKQYLLVSAKAFSKRAANRNVLEAYQKEGIVLLSSQKTAFFLVLKPQNIIIQPFKNQESFYEA